LVEECVDDFIFMSEALTEFTFKSNEVKLEGFDLWKWKGGGISGLRVLKRNVRNRGRLDIQFPRKAASW